MRNKAILGTPSPQPKKTVSSIKPPDQKPLFSADFKKLPIGTNVMFIVKGNPNTFLGQLERVVLNKFGQVDWIHLLCDNKHLKMEAHAWDSHVIAFDLDHKTK